MSKFSANKELEKGVLYCTVRWSNHNNNVNQFLSMNYAEEKYTDVIIACEGHIIKAHKMILAGCSPYFEMLFNNYDAKLQPFGQPMCVVLDGMGIAYPTLQLILEFMYGGEIRVKKSELESLVKGGVKLKVKGLDAVKLGDKQPDKPNEGRTVVGRSELKSPQMVKLAATARAPVPPTGDPSPRKRMIEMTQKTPTPISPKAPVSRVNVPVSQRPVPPPMTALKGEPPDTRKVSDDPRGSQETLVGHNSLPDDELNTSPAKPAQLDEEPVQPELNSRPSSRSGSRSRSSSRSRARKSAAESELTETSEDTIKVPEISPLNCDALEPDNNSEGTHPLKINPNEEGYENGEAEAEPVSKRRTIKKPARLIDMDFVQEIKIPPIKRRKVRDSPARKQLADENAESTPGEETPSALVPEPKKKRKGVFSKFCQEFRDKLQTENPGESGSEITKRLNTMWRNLDPSEKEKYCQLQKVRK